MIFTWFYTEWCYVCDYKAPTISYTSNSDDDNAKLMNSTNQQIALHTNHEFPLITSSQNDFLETTTMFTTPTMHTSQNNIKQHRCNFPQIIISEICNCTKIHIFTLILKIKKYTTVVSNGCLVSEKAQNNSQPISASSVAASDQTRLRACRYLQHFAVQSN